MQYWELSLCLLALLLPLLGLQLDLLLVLLPLVWRQLMLCWSQTSSAFAFQAWPQLASLLAL